MATIASESSLPIFSKEATALDELKSLYLNVLSSRNDYTRRVYDPTQAPVEEEDENDITSSGKPADVKVNSRPQLIDRDIEFQRENFHNLKLAYLEQETKEKFVRAVVSDPPLVIEQADISAIEADNAAKKKELQRHKKECSDLQKQLEDLSREVCEEYEALVGDRTDESLKMIEEMRAMQREIDELEMKHTRLRIPDEEENGDGDEELLLPLESIKELVDMYNMKIEEARSNTLEHLTKELEQKESEFTTAKEMMQGLDDTHERVKKSAQETVKIREHELKRGLEEQEATAKWYKNMLFIFNRALGISDFTAETANDTGSGESTFTFKLLEASFVLQVSNSGRLLTAKVSDPQERVSNDQIQEILNDTLDRYSQDASKFICQMCFLLADLSN